jgi:hypothetical protein
LVGINSIIRTTSISTHGVIDYIDSILVEFNNVPQYRIIGTFNATDGISNEAFYDSGIQIKVIVIKKNILYHYDKYIFEVKKWLQSQLKIITQSICLMQTCTEFI